MHGKCERYLTEEHLDVWHEIPESVLRLAHLILSGRPNVRQKDVEMAIGQRRSGHDLFGFFEAQPARFAGIAKCCEGLIITHLLD